MGRDDDPGVLEDRVTAGRVGVRVAIPRALGSTPARGAIVDAGEGVGVHRVGGQLGEVLEHFVAKLVGRQRDACGLPRRNRATAASAMA